jgi:hypothetical protein
VKGLWFHNGQNCVNCHCQVDLQSPLAAPQHMAPVVTLDFRSPNVQRSPGPANLHNKHAAHSSASPAPSAGLSMPAPCAGADTNPNKREHQSSGTRSRRGSVLHTDDEECLSPSTARVLGDLLADSPGARWASF